MAGRKTRGGLEKRDSRGKKVPREAWATTPGRWYMRYQVNGRRVERALEATTQAGAEAEMAQRLVVFQLEDEVRQLREVKARLTGYEDELREAQAAMAEAASRIPVEAAWDRYEASAERPDSAVKTLIEYRRHWARFAGWCRGAGVVWLHEVSRETAGGFFSQLRDRRGPNTYNKYLGTCKRVWKVLMPDAPSPFARISRRRQVSQGWRPLSADELTRVLASSEPAVRRLILLGFYTTLRLGDCCTLRWDEVDLGQGMIRRQQQKVKSRTGKRVVLPIHPVLQAALADIEDRGEYVFPSFAARHRADKSSISRVVQRRFKRAGIVKDARGRVGFHSLRHTAGTLIGEGGAPPVVLQEIFGHASVAIQWEYLHVSAEAKRRALEALPDVTVSDG